MKIYPSNHLITLVDKTDLNEEIPLGYLNSNFIEETVTVDINNSYSITKKEEVAPYTVFSLSNDEGFPEITFYDNNSNPISREEQELILKRQEDSNNYVYIPNGSVTFDPYVFSYKVLAKKNIKYSSARSFFINVSCPDVDLAKELIQYFSYLEGESLYPNNVSFNNGDSKVESLINSSLRKNDFIFIKSDDGVTYDGETVIDIEEMFENNIIPFIITDVIKESQNPEEAQPIAFELNENIAITSSAYTTDKYFRIPNGEDNITYNNLFKSTSGYAPILIKEHINKGFVVYCTNEFINELNKTNSIFYEVLLSLYLKGYCSTNTISEWITDTMPDYIVQNGKLTKKDKFTSHMELHKLLGLYIGDAEPIEVKIDPPKLGEAPIVYYTGMSSNYLVFKKLVTKEYADPVKSDNQISIFTERKNVIYYDKFIYTITENITDNITYNILDNILYVSIAPFKNSFLDTRNLIATSRIEVKLKKEEDTKKSIVWNNNIKTLEITDSVETKHIELGKISISYDKKTSKLYDMRTRGGGLDEKEKDNYDCLDISTVLGKSYRKGGALIATINLPIEYEKDKDKLYKIIHDSISKNMVADDYLILKLVFNK